MMRRIVVRVGWRRAGWRLGRGGAGRAGGWTGRDGPGRGRVIRQGLGVAGLWVWDVGVVGADGRGRVLGDPIGAQGLLEPYGQGGGGVGPLWLGSVKSNFGHTQAAAGVAGV